MSFKQSTYMGMGMEVSVVVPTYMHACIHMSMCCIGGWHVNTSNATQTQTHAITHVTAAAAAVTNRSVAHLGAEEGSPGSRGRLTREQRKAHLGAEEGSPGSRGRLTWEQRKAHLGAEEGSPGSRGRLTREQRKAHLGAEEGSPGSRGRRPGGSVH